MHLVDVLPLEPPECPEAKHVPGERWNEKNLIVPHLSVAAFPGAIAVSRFSRA